MNLIKELERKKYFYIRKKRKSYDREKANKIKRFLMFCENKDINRIEDIKQSDYDLFMENIKDLSTETKRKYMLALREFCNRAHLSIKINVKTAVNRNKKRKLKQILEILHMESISDEQEKRLLEII